MNLEELDIIIDYLKQFRPQIRRAYGELNSGSVYSPVYSQHEAPPDRIVIVFKEKE